MAKILQNRHKKKQQNIILSDGILLSGSFGEQREKRWPDFFVRAMFLFAIVTGSLGGMVSAFDISYEKWAFFIAAFLSSLYCASLYSAVWWENLGYFLIFVLVLNSGFGLQTYISSGFYGILNDISAAATGFFGSNAQVSYAEQVADHSLAISVAMCYFALIGCIFTNGLISRKMRYLPSTAFSAAFLLIPIYLEKEPSISYIILLTAGLITVYILRQNQYSCQNAKQKSRQKAAAKHLFTGDFSGKAAISIVLAVSLLCSVFVGILGFVIPEDIYLSENKRSAFKARTMDTVENFYLLGVMGLINFYPTTGGLVSGRLGGVNSVRLDYETDLTLEFVPYTYERIYLKSFVGTIYVPYENHWQRYPFDEGWAADTARRLEKAFRSGNGDTAKGIMTIKNVAAPTSVYLPYYSVDITKNMPPGTTQDYTFYPLLTDHLEGNAEIPTPEMIKLWLEVPEQNQSVIADFCNKAELAGSVPEVIGKLRTYFQDNFPYTLSPGITPRRKDFVNYFLNEKQKGYCAHYASAATLILRHMGIPARYVEGYAIDAIDIANDGKLTDKDASDYYEGASQLAQNSVISYDASDGNAHAWVEIYDENLGWYPIELTPYQTEEDENQDSIWNMFLKLFQSGQDDTSADNNTAGGGAIIANALRTSAYGLVICFVLLLLVFPTGLLIRKTIWLYRFYNADRNVKLMMQYRNKLRTIQRKNRKNKDLMRKKNFEEEVNWIYENNFLKNDIAKSKAASPESLIQTLNKAAFSQNEISVKDYEAAINMLS